MTVFTPLVAQVTLSLPTSLVVSVGVPMMNAGAVLDLVKEGGAEDAEVAGTNLSFLGHSMCGEEVGSTETLRIRHADHERVFRM